LEIDAWQINRDTSARFTGFDVSLLQFLDQSLILSNLGALSIDGFLLLCLFYLLSLELITDQSAGSETEGTAHSCADARTPYRGADNSTGSGAA
jgi:hypothetical protein